MRSFLLVITLVSVSTVVSESAFAQTLYVPGGGINNLPAIVDTGSKSIVGFLQSGGYAQFMAISPDGSRAYITDPFHLVLAVVDLATDTRIATIPTVGYPSRVVLSNDGTRAYLIASNAGVGPFYSVLVIDTGTNTVVAQVALPVAGANLAISRTSPRLYVGTFGGVLTIDTTTNSIVNSMAVPNLLVLGIVPSSDGSKLYLIGRDDANSSVGYVLTLDLGLGTVTVLAPLGFGPADLVMTPDGSRLYASYQGPPSAFTGALVAVDVASGGVIGTVPLYGYVGEIGLAPAGNEVWVAVNDPLSNAVEIINPTTLAVTARITGFWGGAHDLVWAPTPPVNYEAEASGNILAGKARVVSCAVCSGGAAVAGVAEPGSGPTGGSLTFVNIAGVPQPQAELSIYYQHSQSVPITAAVTVNGVTTVLNFPPVPLGANGPSRIALTIPGQTISTVKITGVQGTSSSSLTIDSVTVQ
jgi:YVTN family beta-propeller protein